MGKIKKFIGRYIYNIVLYSIAFVCLIIFSVSLDFNNLNNVAPIQYALLGIGIVILLLPSVEKIKFGDLIEIEKKVEDNKEEFDKFRLQTNSMFQVMSNSISNINLSSNNNATYFTVGNVENTNERLKNLSTENEEIQQTENKEIIERVTNEVIFEDDDLRISMARIRMKIEQILTEICYEINPERKENSMFSISSMIEILSEYMMQNGYAKSYVVLLRRNLNTVVSLANKAIHGHIINDSESFVKEIKIGIELIGKLEKIKEKVISRESRHELRA